jgi:hypothetical protein
MWLQLIAPARPADAVTVAAAARLIHLSAGLECGAAMTRTAGRLISRLQIERGQFELAGPLDNQTLGRM